MKNLEQLCLDRKQETVEGSDRFELMRVEEITLTFYTSGIIK